MIYYLLIILLSLTLSKVNSAEVTKICGNEDCSEILYTASVTRPYVSDHENFLSFEVGELLQVHAIKFSNRVDIIEVSSNATGARGLVYKSMVDSESLVFWLFSVVKQNIKVYEVFSYPKPGYPKVFKIKNANPFLLRDYIVNARNAGMEPENIPELEDPDKVKKGHHHHHQTHDHHDHSDEHHDHSTLAASTVAPPNVEPKQTAVPNPTVSLPPLPRAGTTDPLKKISLDVMAKGAAIPQLVKTLQSDTTDEFKKQQTVEAFVVAQEEAAAAKFTAEQAKEAKLAAEITAAKIAVEKVEHAEALVVAQKEAVAAKVAAEQAQVIQQTLQSTLNVEPLKVIPNTPPVVLNTVRVSASVDSSVEVQDVPGANQVNLPSADKAFIPVESLSTPTLNNVVTPPPVSAETVTASSVVSNPPIQPVLNPDIYNSIIDTVDTLPSTPPTPIIDVPVNPQPLPVVTPVPIVQEMPTLVVVPVTPLPLPVEIPIIVSEHQTDTQPPVADPAEFVATTPISVVEKIPVMTTNSAPLPMEPEVVASEAPVPVVDLTVKPDTISDNDEMRHQRSVLQDGVDNSDDFCFNNDCSDRSVAVINPVISHDLESRQVNDGFLATKVRPAFKSIAVTIRSSLPYPISHFDDTGLFVLLNFILALIVYTITWLSVDSRRPDVFDRRAFHDALSRLKEQEIHIRKLQANASDPSVITQYTQQIDNLRNACAALTSQLNAATEVHKRVEADLAEANSERNSLQFELHNANSEKADLLNKYEAISTENSTLKLDLGFVHRQMEEANTRTAGYIAELQDAQKMVRELNTIVSEEKKIKSALEAAIDRLKETVTSLEKQLEAKNHSNHEYTDMVAELNEQKKALERQIVVLEEKIAAPIGSGGPGSGESNASNGWSDMDFKDLDSPEDVPLTNSADDTLVEDTEVGLDKKPVKVATLGKKPPKQTTLKESSSIVDDSRKTSLSHASIEVVMEMKALRDTVRDVKVDRDNLKRELASEQRSRESVEAALEDVKKNLAEKKAELEKAIANFDKCSAKNDQLDQRNADMYRKIERLEEQCAKIIELKESINLLTLEKAASNNRVKDLERQLKKAEERAENIDRLRYLDERKLKEKIAELEDHLTKLKVAQPVTNDGIGSRNSSDRDFSITNVSASAVASLWDNIDDPETSFDGHPNLRSNCSRRRSDRFLPPVEPSGRRSVGRRPEGHSSTTHRYRSRSAGRQRYPATSPYDEIPSGSDRHFSRTSHPYGDYGRSLGVPAADIRLRRSTTERRGANFVYSSDGSGACSPPPELASESGVPPTTIKIHKPAPKK